MSKMRFDHEQVSVESSDVRDGKDTKNLQSSR